MVCLANHNVQGWFENKQACGPEGPGFDTLVLTDVQKRLFHPFKIETLNKLHCKLLGAWK